MLQEKKVLRPNKQNKSYCLCFGEKAGKQCSFPGKMLLVDPTNLESQYPDLKAKDNTQLLQTNSLSKDFFFFYFLFFLIIVNMYIRLVFYFFEIKLPALIFAEVVGAFFTRTVFLYKYLHHYISK